MLNRLLSIPLLLVLTDILHYGLYKKQVVLLVFCFCRKVVFAAIYNLTNIFIFQKNQIFSFSFLASQRSTHPLISVHMTLNVARIDM